MYRGMPRVRQELSRHGGVTLVSAVGSPPGESARVLRQGPWTWPLSVAAHALFLVLLVLLGKSQALVAPPPRSIDVQVLTPAEYDASIGASGTPAPPVLRPTPAPLVPSPIGPIGPIVPATQPPVTPPPQPQASALEGGMVHALRLYSTGLLREAASLEVKNTLPTLAPYERLTQLCNIEATEQIRRAVKGANPETVSASAFAETELVNGVLKASGAAYRSHAKWFAIAFECTVRSDLAGVADFSFKLGPAIPRDQWDAHDLIGIDEDDEDLGSVPP